MKHLYVKVISVILILCMIAVPITTSAYTYNGSETVTGFTAHYYSNTTFDCYLEDETFYSVGVNPIGEWFRNLSIEVRFSDNTSVNIADADIINESSINGIYFDVVYNTDGFLRFGENDIHIYYDDMYITVPITINMIYGDVSKNNWFYNAVVFVSNNEIMNGTSHTSFAPNALLTRSMFVTMLYRIFGEDENVDSYAQPFSDVQNSWYTDAVKWAYHYGVVSGTSATTFSPNNNITREEMCKMMASFCSVFQYDLQEGTLPFADTSSISSWAKKSVAQCFNNKIVKGKNASRFDPKGKATRAEAATVIMNAANNVMTNLDWIN